jgi:hypothetical protein
MKSEARNPKSERSPKPEIRIAVVAEVDCGQSQPAFGIRHSDFFRHSAFGFRFFP